MQIGFKKGAASPCNFYHAGRKVAVTVHGDDVTSCGMPADLKWLDAKLKEKYDIKTSVLGPDPQLGQSTGDQGAEPRPELDGRRNQLRG